MSQPYRARFWWLGTSDDVTTGLWVSSESFAAILADMQAASVASLIQARYTVAVAPGTPPAATGSSLQAARLNFLTETGANVPVLVPGLAAAGYASDGTTVDPGASIVAAVIADIIASGTDASGNAITAFSAGYKIQLAQPPLTRPGG
jgi:hypothetical protein